LSIRDGKNRIRDDSPGSAILQCCGSGIRCLFYPGIGIGFFRISDPGSQTHIFESTVKNLWVKNFNNSLKIGPNFFLQHFKNKIIFNFVNFVTTKKSMITKKIFSLPSFVAVIESGIRDPGSGMGKNQDPGSWINIPDLQHCNTGYKFAASCIRILNGLSFWCCICMKHSNEFDESTFSDAIY
jgi:hypothetical protein